MSFMAGFGDSFSKSFNAGIERKEQRRDDTFKLMYNDFISRRDKQDEYKREDAKRVKLAKTLVQMAPNAPEGAWVNAYEWLNSGLDEDAILANLQTGKFSPSELPAGETQSPVASQTEAAMQSSTPKTPTTPAPAKPTLGPIGEMSKFFTQEEDYAIDAKKRIAEIIGLSEEEVSSVINGGESVQSNNPMKFQAGLPAQTKVPELDQAIFNLNNARTPEELKIAQSQVNAIKLAKTFEAEATARAKAAAEGLGFQGGMVRVQNEDGSMEYVFGQPTPEGGVIEFGGQGRQFSPGQFLPVQKEEYESLKRLRELSGNKAYQSYMNKIATVPTLLRTADQTADLIQNNPQMQTPWVASAAQTIYNVAAEVLNAKDLFLNSNPGKILEDIKNGGTGSQEEYVALKTLEQRLEEALGNGITDLAVASTLRDTRTALFAYELAKMSGQEGRELQEPERKMFAQLATGGVTYEQFMENMGGIINNYTAQAAQEREAFNQYNTDLKFHRDVYNTTGGIELPDIMETIEKSVPEEYKRFKEYDPQTSTRFNTGPNKAPKVPGKKEETLAPAGPPVGTEMKDSSGKTRRFKGGNPNEEANWEIVQ